VQLRGDPAGRYELAALGATAASAETVLRLVGALAQASRPAQALELAAAFAERYPRAPRRGEVLLAAGRIAEESAATVTPEAAAAYGRASQRLGVAIYERGERGLAYVGAFEARVGADEPSSAEASARLARLAPPAAVQPATQALPRPAKRGESRGEGPSRPRPPRK
jgi:hypothetical protein